MKWFAVCIVFGSALAYYAMAALPIPAITVFPATFYPLENILFMEGTASPQSVVEVILRQHEERFITLRTNTDNRGIWSLGERVFLEEGRWEIRARSTKDDTASDWSEPKVITSVVTGVGFGRFSITYPVAASILVTLLVLGGSVFAYLAIRVSRVRRQLLKKEMHEAHRKITEGFHTVRSNIIDELRSVEEEAKNGHVNADILARREKLLTELHKLEEDLEREVEDAEKLS